MIAAQYGVSRQTVIYHLFPEYKAKQKKYLSKTWSYEKQNPEIHKKRIQYKAKYMAARRHIAGLVSVWPKTINFSISMYYLIFSTRKDCISIRLKF
jgi:hypothetical protein